MTIADFLHRFTKQADEQLSITIDFSERLGTGETLVSAGSIIKCYDLSGNDLSSTMVGTIDWNDDDVQVLMKGGTTGLDYKITVLANTSAGQKVEHDVLMMIRNE